MRKRNLAVLGVLLAAACATERTALKETLNERSEALAHLEDRRPPNPNMPRDARELKAIPHVVQRDPGLQLEEDAEAIGSAAGAEVGAAGSKEPLLSDRVRAQLPNSNLEITSHGSAVTLKGVVQSEEERAAIETAARRVEGVGTVNNELIVNPPLHP